MTPKMKKIKFTAKMLDNMAMAVKDNVTVIVGEGAIRSSKTVTMIQAFNTAVRMNPCDLHFIASKDLDAVRDNLLHSDGLGLMDQFPDIAMEKEPIGGYYITIPGFDGRIKKVLLVGYSKKDQWKKILGKTIGVELIDEVNLASEQFLDEAFARQASADKPLTMYTLNGDDPNHYCYQKYINYCKPLGKVPASILADMNKFPNKKGWYYMHWTMYDNPAMTPEKIERTNQIYPIDSYYHRIKIKGERGIAEGLIYTLFATRQADYLIKKEDLPMLSQINIGMDFGGNGSAHTFVATGINRAMTDLYVLRSKRIPAKDVTPDKLYDAFELFFKDVQLRFGFRAMNVYCDSAEQTLIAGLRNRVLAKSIGAIIKNALKKEIKDRIEFEQMVLSIKRIHVLDEGCESFIEAFRTAVYNSKPGHTSERLDDGTTDIDSMDAFEYSIESNMRNIMINLEVVK